MMNSIMNVQIDKELHRRVKILTATHGQTIREYVENAIRYQLTRDGLPRVLVDPGVPYAKEE